jgi:hypothetical protein
VRAVRRAVVSGIVQAGHSWVLVQRCIILNAMLRSCA